MVTMKLLGKFLESCRKILGKTYEMLLEAQLYENQTKNIITKYLKYFSENIR